MALVRGYDADDDGDPEMGRGDGGGDGGGSGGSSGGGDSTGIGKVGSGDNGVGHDVDDMYGGRHSTLQGRERSVFNTADIAQFRGQPWADC